MASRPCVWKRHHPALMSAVVQMKQPTQQQSMSAERASTKPPPYVPAACRRARPRGGTPPHHPLPEDEAMILQETHHHHHHHHHRPNREILVRRRSRKATKQLRDGHRHLRPRQEHCRRTLLWSLRHSPRPPHHRGRPRRSLRPLVRKPNTSPGHQAPARRAAGSRRVRATTRRRCWPSSGGYSLRALSYRYGTL